MNFFKKIGGVITDTVKKCKTVAVAVAVGALGIVSSSAYAAGEAVNTSPVQRAADGTITFTPQNIMAPVIDGAISAWTAWSSYAIIGIVLVIMFLIFKRK